MILSCVRYLKYSQTANSIASSWKEIFTFDENGHGYGQERILSWYGKKAHFRLFFARSHLKVISTDAIKIHAH